jgi:dipeptidyl aminopeptidase/acylaminoacyl peptidase
MNTAPYGSWPSPITADMVATAGVALGQAALDGDDVYWTEMRPVEGGRYVVVRRAPGGATADVTPPGYNVRTRVHEYGGGAFAVAGGAVWFSNFADQRLYRQDAGGAPRAITPEGPYRYADAAVDTVRGLLYCVREDHADSDIFAANTLVRVPLDGDGTAGDVIVEGHDFFSTPRLSPDGARLCWLAWDHPNMPWDGTELWVADVAADGALSNPTLVAGGRRKSIFQPSWSPGGVLHFVSDRSGWWNLYRRTDGGDEALCPMEAEFGRPQWQFGMSAYAFAGDGRIVCTYIRDGMTHLATLDGSGRLADIDLPYTSIGEVRALGGRAVIIAGSASEAPAVVAIDLATNAREVLRRSSDVAADAAYISAPEAIEFPTEGGRTAHAIYYRPKNAACTAPGGERPPLIVKSHGGPTGAASTTLSLGIQYWTSRGFAVVDVNYGGSTGYGRAYRERLNGTWGITDVDDCVNAARYLVERGEADPARLIITGGSAGGYTTLCALTFRDVFSAGASYFGVADAEGLAKDTHKFESRYLDNLIGPYPERADLYRERSPIHHTDRLSRPVIFFQGLEDQIVPPNQAEAMVASLRAKGVPFAYVPFAGEQHGFRRAENIRRSLEAELYFYGQVLAFAIADEVEPVAIEGLPAR